MAFSYNVGGGYCNTGKRAEPRVPIPPVAVRVTGDNQHLYGYARDVSRSGMQLRAFMAGRSNIKKAGDRIHVSFALPEAGLTVECDARVVWNIEAEHVPGAVNIQGITFLDMDDEVGKRLAAWVDANRLNS